MKPIYKLWDQVYLVSPKTWTIVTGTILRSHLHWRHWDYVYHIKYTVDTFSESSLMSEDWWYKYVLVDSEPYLVKLREHLVYKKI